MRSLTAILAVAAVCLCTAGQAAARTLRAPGLQSPGNGANVESLPAFTWTGVAGAASYQFEFSADKDFSSAVQGFAEGPIPLTTTAITNDKSIPNGTYYWRVRALTAKDKVGHWSRLRTLHKNWNQQPILLSPLGTTVNWPSQP
ncbi:MAG TPA: hypothetical protein VG228_01410, partial [Solirubrobacteraceae bacterium]|nr:hypothetical protein [Solirubrobacteraceae bacterium]